MHRQKRQPGTRPSPWPAAQDIRGDEAPALLWRDRVVGWGNLSVRDGALQAQLGYVAARPPRDRAFRGQLEAELERGRAFLGLQA